MNESKTLLATLSNAAGTPGNEGEIRDIIRQELRAYAEFSYDKMGSIICRRKAGKDAPKIMLAGHMDEVGFIVRLIAKDGFIKFHNLGGWWGHSMLAQRVVIKSAAGDVPGIIGAPAVHHLTPEQRKQVMKISEIHIDVGAKDREEAMELFGIRPGDHIVPDTHFKEMKNPRLLSGKAFDDRVGVALSIDAFKQLADDEMPNGLYGVGTTQEEVGTRGAGTAVELVSPDVAIILEGSPADDTPGFNGEDSQGELGKGPQIRLFDPTMIANKKLTQYVLKTAKAHNIPHQAAVRTSGGTDGRTIHVHKSGVPTIVIAPPVRYIHSHVGLLNLDDYEQTLKLLLALVRGLDTDTANSFSDYS
ncbi:MAG: M42 family metallopeptidase [bacterium]|nr:M42 family metallopeptidase [bacterium]